MNKTKEPVHVLSEIKTLLDLVNGLEPQIAKEVLLNLVQELKGVTEHVRSRLRTGQPKIVLPEAGLQKEHEVQAILDHNVAVIQLGPLEDAQIAVGRLSLKALGIDPGPWLAAYRTQIKQRETKHGDV